MKLYISGQITGQEGYLDIFADAQRRLEHKGYEVLNPAPYSVEGWTWPDYMEKDLKDLRTCDGVATLINWKNSAGANIEVLYAKRLGLPVHAVKWWVDDRAPIALRNKEVSNV